MLNDDQPHLYLPELFLICATRYALGRKSYVVYEVTAYIEGAWDELTDQARQVIQQDIQKRLEREERVEKENYSPLGPEDCRERWVQILELDT